MTRFETTYTKKLTGQVIFCDICHKRIETQHYSHCGTCDRDVCHSCWTDKDMKQITENLYAIPCPACRALPATPDFVKKLEDLHAAEDALREKIWKMEAAWGKASRKANPPPKIAGLREKNKKMKTVVIIR